MKNINTGALLDMLITIVFVAAIGAFILYMAITKPPYRFAKPQEQIAQPAQIELSPKEEIKLTYSQWKFIAEKSMDNQYIFWPDRELYKSVITKFIDNTEWEFKGALFAANQREVK